MNTIDLMEIKNYKGLWINFELRSRKNEHNIEIKKKQIFGLWRIMEIKILGINLSMSRLRNLVIIVLVSSIWSIFLKRMTKCFWTSIIRYIFTITKNHTVEIPVIYDLPSTRFTSNVYAESLISPWPTCFAMLALLRFLSCVFVCYVIYFMLVCTSFGADFLVSC